MRRNVQQRQRKMTQHAKARCGKNGQTVLAQLETSHLRSTKLPGSARETSSGASCRNRRQLPPTRRSPSRASQTADDVSAFPVDTLCLESNVSTKDVIGHVAPTRQFPPRASQRLTMCQRCLSPDSWNANQKVMAWSSDWADTHKNALNGTANNINIE